MLLTSGQNHPITLNTHRALGLKFPTYFPFPSWPNAMDLCASDVPNVTPGGDATPLTAYLTPAKKNTLELIAAVTETYADYPRDRCLHELLVEQAERWPDSVAVQFENKQLTYAELDRRSNQLAHFLVTKDVGPESLVGLCVERSLEMVIGLLGILKAGGAYVPLDPAY